MGALSIPLQVNPPAPQPGPIQSLTGLLQARDLMSQIALRQAQGQNVAGEAAIRQQGIKDQQTLMQALQDPDHPEYAKQYGQGDLSFLNGKVTPGFQNTLATQVTKLAQDKATLSGDQLANASKAHNQIEQSLTNLTNADMDPARRVDQLQSLVGQWSSNGLLKDAGIDPQRVSQLVQNYDGSPEATQRFLSLNGLMAGVTAKAQELQKEQAATEASKATARESTAKAVGQETINTQIQKALANDGQGQTASGETAIHSMFNPAGATQSLDPDSEAAFVTRYRATPALPSQTDPTGQAARQAVLTDALKHVEGIGMKTSPVVSAAESQQAAANAKAVNPFEIARANAQANYEHALRQGDTAQAQYYDSLKDLNQSLGTAQTIQKVVDLSKGEHNEIAAAQLKALVPEFTNAIQNIKRMAASQGDKGLGSTAAHLESEATSLFSGKPLSDTLINEITPYIQTIANGATLQHNGNVSAIKKAYPTADFQTEALPFPAQAAKPASAATGQKIIVKDALGGQHPFDTEAQAQTFENLVKQNGGTTSR